MEAELEAEAADAAPPVAEPPAPVDDSPPERTDDDTVLFDAEDEVFADSTPADTPSGDTPESGFAPVEEPAEREERDSGATQEYDPFADEEEPEAEAEPPADAAAEDEEDGEDGEDGDVLEDTPDFLQETPEHDRLWFEQKPPRDFDFD